MSDRQIAKKAEIQTYRDVTRSYCEVGGGLENRRQELWRVTFGAVPSGVVNCTYESATDLWSKKAPEHSIPGIALACVSLIVMPLLSRAKRKVGRALGSSAMHADAKQTEFCTYLSGILLAGLLLNILFGLWWADPVAALIMVPIILKEGLEGLQGKACVECSA